MAEEAPPTKDDLRKAVHDLANIAGVISFNALHLWQQHPPLRPEGLGDLKDAAERLPAILAQLRRFL